MIYPKASCLADTAKTAIPAAPRFPEIEERVLAYWKEDRTFEASVARNTAG